MSLTGCGAEIFPDLLPNKHTIGGLYTALVKSRSQNTFVCACDMPLINTNLVEALFDLIDSHEAVVPSISGLAQPLCAVYSKEAAEKTRDQIDNGNFKMIELIEKLDTKVIDGDLLRKFDPELESFININTIGDYQATLERLSK